MPFNYKALKELMEREKLNVEDLAIELSKHFKGIDPEGLSEECLKLSVLEAPCRQPILLRKLKDWVHLEEAGFKPFEDPFYIRGDAHYDFHADVRDLDMLQSFAEARGYTDLKFYMPPDEKERSKWNK